MINEKITMGGVQRMVSSKIGFIDTGNLITQIDVTGATTYTATENCWIFAVFGAESAGTGAGIYIDGVMVCASIQVTSASATYPASALFPVRKGQVVTTRGGSHKYRLSVYGMEGI